MTLFASCLLWIFKIFCSHEVNLDLSPRCLTRLGCSEVQMRSRSHVLLPAFAADNSGLAQTANIEVYRSGFL